METQTTVLVSSSGPSKAPKAPEDAPEILGEPVTLEELVTPTAASARSKETTPQTFQETETATKNNECVEESADAVGGNQEAAEAEAAKAAVEVATMSEATIETETVNAGNKTTVVTTDDANENNDSAVSAEKQEEAEEVDFSADVMVELPSFDDEEDDEFHEAMEDEDEELDEVPDKLTAATVPPTMSFSVNEMEVITNRGGRSGSLSKFLDDADTYRRRSLPSYPDDQLFAGSLSQKKMSLTAFLDMQIDPVLEILEDTDSDIRLWLMQPETVKEVLAEFVTPPILTGEPHEEYGYYKKHFLCSEIIMKLYTGEEDLYESFSSDSSSGSTASTAVFGCQEQEDIDKWEQLYSIFKNPIPLDEMQLLFFSKALVRLHDGFCLEEGYVNNILKRFLPMVIPHLYSNTIKYMLTLILQSYESVHPITGRNDAMEIVAPLLAEATRVNPTLPENLPLVENTTNLLVDMLQANQADRLGAFSRREGGVYLSKYFVRDQFGTIRGFESMTHGYHNFLQYMLLEEMSKQPSIIEDLFSNASQELATIRDQKLSEVSSALNVHVASELLVLCQKLLNESAEGDDENNQVLDDTEAQKTQMSFGYSSFSSEPYPNSPHEGGNDTSMYNLTSLPRGYALWTYVLEVARKTANSFVSQLNKGLPSSVEISLAKYLNNLVLLNDAGVDEELHKSGLIQAYLSILEKRSSFDMLIIHVVPAISFILRDADASRAKNCPLTKDLFGVDVSVPENIISLLLRTKIDIPSLDIYAAILHDLIDEVFTSKTPSQNNAQLVFHCKRSPAVFKRLRKSLVTTHVEKSDKKVLALSNEPFPSQNVAPRQTDVFVVDTSRGEDITSFAHRDAGVVVTDVPAASSKTSESGERSMNVITAGYMYKNKYPETGQRNIWERYYFVLNRADGSLSYYISEAHAKDRTFVRGTSRPLTVSEGIPMHVHGQNSVFGFQINTQGHGAFMVLVDSIDTRLTWLTEILVCVSNVSPPLPKQRLSLSPDDAPKQRLSATTSSLGSIKCSKEEMRELVVDFYRNLFGPKLKFSSPLDAPASFWMEEKIDPVSDGCVLSSNLPDCVPYWGEFHGYKRLCDYWKMRDETVERSNGRVLRILVDEDEETAVVMTSTTFRILRNSEIVTEESCDIVSVSGGSIVSIHCTFDSHRIAQAFKKEGISAS
ncbi:hypothetical protein BBO99_00003582 [Phytophthora kernoviae]|uniref:PH domain-containing protein n=1 Tax=Phytophthora kernoviae TaxID=325452 RepID=A0A421F856_9STRA|nr:hypothetical protein BBI17_003745 [Phytophthora kernoviae]RLN81593.1 hypothetical protein BBO99_00003582 [Phytophthora kernoviae]